MYSDTLNIAALLEAIGKIEVYSHNSADAHSDIPWQKIKDFRDIVAMTISVSMPTKYGT